MIFMMGGEGHILDLLLLFLYLPYDNFIKTFNW